MTVDAEISLYPLRSVNLSKPIGAFLDRLRETALHVESGPMSSRLRGDCVDLFGAVGDAFEKSAEKGDVVLVMKVSNACGSPGDSCTEER